MKYLLAIIIASGFFFQGCYTVLWTPDRSMPEYYETNNYYYDNDIYITYYDYPWWVEVAPAYNDYNNAPERKTHDRIIRNNGGRNTGSSREPVIRTGSAGVSGGGGSGSSSSETPKTERRTTTEDSSPKTERSGSGNNDKPRNSGSDRNSGGRR